MVRRLVIIVASILILAGIAGIFFRVEAELRQGDLTSGNPQAQRAN